MGYSIKIIIKWDFRSGGVFAENKILTFFITILWLLEEYQLREDLTSSFFHAAN